MSNYKTITDITYVCERCDYSADSVEEIYRHIAALHSNNLEKPDFKTPDTEYRLNFRNAMYIGNTQLFKEKAAALVNANKSDGYDGEVEGDFSSPAYYVVDYRYRDNGRRDISLETVEEHVYGILQDKGLDTPALSRIKSLGKAITACKEYNLADINRDEIYDSIAEGVEYYLREAGKLINDP